MLPYEQSFMIMGTGRTAPRSAARRSHAVGPDSLSAQDLADLYAELGGRPVTAVALARRRCFRRSADRRGRQRRSSEVGAELVTSYGRAIREGHFDVTTTAVEDLTGRQAISLRDVLTALHPVASA